MAGGGFLPPSSGDRDGEEYDLDEQGTGGHAVQWVGTPGVKGPRWARMSLLTVGMLGIQCVWSIEMGYASPYLLELGLSKSYMSLVFMAGPLSGLIVQPLIGVFADRSKSRWGRRRPFMLAGVAVCAFAMMLLGWAKTIGEAVGSSAFAIFLAVWAIYLIDFSINAAMSTDRALVVDTLPPSQQEEGSAWAGRMFGFGSVAGFFVGNLDLTGAFSFLGGSQIQILSFLTGGLLLITHGFTSWAVSERVLLRDDRPQSKSSFGSNLRAIWENIFTLPPGIRSVCYIQFFAFLGWFPILFFTSIWITEIYKRSYVGDASDEEIEAEGVRAGARALLFQAIINVITSVGLPFLVAESGVQPSLGSGAGAGYEALGGDAAMHMDRPPTPAWKTLQRDLRSGGGVVRIAKRWIAILADRNTWTLPIQGFTLIRVWWISQFIFAAAMAATWFITTLRSAYLLIALTGFCWSLCQWAPYSLLGELILIDRDVNRSTNQLSIIRTRPSTDIRRSISRHGSPAPPRAPLIVSPGLDHSSPSSTPFQTAHGSRATSPDRDADPNIGLNLGPDDSFRSQDRESGGEGLTPLVIQTGFIAPSPLDRVVLRHSDESSVDRDRGASPHKGDHDHDEDEDEDGELMDELSFGGGMEDSPISHHPNHRMGIPSPGLDSRTRGRGAGAGTGTADKAGVILGIHNVFVVMPQFIITFLASIIFYLMEPEKGLPGHHPQAQTPVPVPASGNTTASTLDIIERAGKLVLREGGVGAGASSSPDAVGLIFRIGGVSAAIGGVICLRLARSWARGQGI